MKMLNRLLGIYPVEPSKESDRAAGNAELNNMIERERQQLRQTVQRIESGTNIPMTWAGAMKLINEPDRYPLKPGNKT